MIVKPSISFLNTDSDSQLIADTETITTAMDENPYFVLPSPSLAAISGAQAVMVTAMAAAADGGITLTAIKNAKRALLVALLRQLASYVEVTSNGDLTVLMSSGFPIQKPQRDPIGVLPAPSNLTVGFGARTGELHAVAKPLVGAAIYNWRVTTAAAPTVVVQTAQTTAASNTFTGLTPGVVYNIEVNALGSAGPSNWSDPVPQMAV
jgi:hypothetical protein